MITTLHDPDVAEVDGELQLEIQITFAPGTIDPGAVRFSVAPGRDGVADRSVLPLVPAALVLACRTGQDLRVDEALPPAVHRGARHVAHLLHQWYGWRPAELIAPLGPDPVRPRWARRPRGTGLFFTRGVDSWGTFLDLRDGPRANRPTHLITLDNEVHLSPAVRQAQLDETQRAADELGLPLIVVRTDVRSMIDPHTDWGTQTHGSVLAGVGLLLRSSLDHVVIAPTHWTPLLRPWGSHPDLDPAWSLPDLRVTHHDGSEMRWQRVRRIVDDPTAARTLMVCWQGTGTRNCGRCEKCLRLLTSLQLLGRADELADRFDAPLDLAAIGPELVVSPHPWCDTIDHLDRIGLAADPIRQRWEQVRVVGRPAVWFQTRPRQPRLPVTVAAAGSERDQVQAVERLGRRLAALGLRIDHEAQAEGPGAALHLEPGPTGAWTAAVVGAAGHGSPVPIAGLRAEHVRPLLDALGLDPAAAVPFAPDGQDPPPVVPEPPGWEPEPEAAAAYPR